MKILVCYDGTEVSERALNKALDAFGHFNPLFILATVARTGQRKDDKRSSGELLMRELKEVVHATGKKLTDDGKRVQVNFSVGEPRATLYEMIKDEIPDYVIVGRRNLTAFGEIGEKILGSVSEYLVHHTVIPVLVCH